MRRLDFSFAPKTLCLVDRCSRVLAMVSASSAKGALTSNSACPTCLLESKEVEPMLDSRAGLHSFLDDSSVKKVFVVSFQLIHLFI